MKSILISVIFILLSALTSFANDSNRWTLRKYVEEYLAQSKSIQDQEKAITDLEVELEAAKVRRESPLYLEEKQVELDSARMKVREIVNSELIQGVELYLAYVAAVRDVEAARSSVEITEKEHQTTKARFDAKEEAEKELLNDYLSLLQARKSLAGAEKREADSNNALVRELDLDQDESFETLIAWSETIPENIVLEITAIRESSSDYYSAFHTKRLKESQLETKRNSQVFTPDEIEAAEDEFENARDQLETVSWNLEDEKITLEYELSTQVADTEIFETNLRLNTIDLELLQLQFSYGEVFETDLENARQRVRDAETDLHQSRESLFQLHLRAADLNSGDCWEVLADWLDLSIAEVN